MSSGKSAGNGADKRPGGLRGLIYHNAFVLALSFVSALVLWFVMASGNVDANRIVADVPIEVRFSAEAEAQGLRVFSMSYDEADLEISGSSLITSRLTPDDFTVTATLDPVSTKLTGNTVQRITAPVTATKNSAMSEYTIESVNPEEVTLVYDRYQEVTFPLDTSEVDYSVNASYVADQPTLSEESVTVSGPESSVNKISRAAVSASYGTALKETTTFPADVVLYDYDNKPIDLNDSANQYLSVSIEQVEVTVAVLFTKTVDLVPTNLVRRPANFPDSRIEVDPPTVTLVGAEEVLAGISSIELDTPIDFASLDGSQSSTFTMDIPLPNGVWNLNAPAGEAGKATVTVNLNAYETVQLSIPAENIQFLNVPEGKNVALESKGLSVNVIGPQAQVNRLVGEGLTATVDLTNFAEQTGRLQAPASVSVAGDGADSCWALGSYTVTLSLEDASVQTAADVLAENPAATAGS